MSEQDLVPPTSGQPLHIHVDIMVFEVSKIDDIALSLTFELYFDLRWRETRLIINDRDFNRERVITPWKIIAKVLVPLL